jgi:hypothetical protein
LNGPDAPELVIEEFENELVLYLNNPITSNNYNQGYNEQDPTLIPPGADSLPDDVVREFRTYRFQGYKIYQVFDNSVGANDLNDVSKARLIAQVDVRDSVSRIINYYTDPDIGKSVPVLEVDGENEGISTSFRITQDVFAVGDNKLVNNRAYYFMALSYAYNGNHPTLPYLGSRKGTTGSIKAVKGIPHNVSVKNGGTILRAKYGDGVEITQIEGTGNGGNGLRLNQESLDKILANGKSDTLTYLPGFGPVNIKVVNPLKVKPGVYTLWFRDSATTGDLSDAYWMITTEGSEDTIVSTNTITVGTETIIFDLGISLNIGQIKPPGGSKTIRETDQGVISIDFDIEDSSKLWLGGVPDADGTTPLNWVLSGSAATENVVGSNLDESAYDDWNYYMEEVNDLSSKKGKGLDDAQIWERTAGAGGLAPFRLTGHRTSNGAIPGYLRAAVKMKNTSLISDIRPHVFLYDYGAHGDSAYYISLDSMNQLNNLSSVNIVFTSDKSKWTRCPVLEMQDSLHLSKGNAIRGQLRDAPSVDKDGNPGDSSAAPSNDPNSPNYIGSKGMGWFPGYAINVETGERLNMAFGEDSYLAAENGADMMWNPTSTLTEGPANEIRLGGMHMIYVFRNNIIEDEVMNIDMADPARLAANFPWYSFDQNKPEFRMPAYDNGKFAYEQLKDVRGYYSVPTVADTTNLGILSKATSVFRAGMYVIFPFNILNTELLQSDLQVRVRVQRPYQNRGTGNQYVSYGEPLEVGQEYYVNAGPVKHFISADQDSVFYTGQHFVAANTQWKPEYRNSKFGGNDSTNVLMKTINGGRPLYNFNTIDIAPSFNNQSVAEEMLECMRVVPNPYYAYSQYETDKIDNRVRITCLPKTVTVRIYTINGTLVRTLTKDDDSITFLEWDLKNQARVPVSSGVYIMHVEVPGVGEKVLKWMGVMRPVDLDNF